MTEKVSEMLKGEWTICGARGQGKSRVVADILLGEGGLLVTKTGKEGAVSNKANRPNVSDLGTPRKVGQRK